MINIKAGYWALALRSFGEVASRILPFTRVGRERERERANNKLNDFSDSKRNDKHNKEEQTENDEQQI